LLARSRDGVVEVGAESLEVVAPADGAVAGDEHVPRELRDPLDDPRPRLRVAVAHPRVAADEHEVGGEEHSRVREVQERVARGMPAAVGEELGAAEASPLVEELVRQAMLGLGDGFDELRRRVAGRFQLLLEGREPLLAAARDQLARRSRRDDRRLLEDLVPPDVVAVPVAVDDDRRRGQTEEPNGLEEVTSGGGREERVEDERLARELDDAGVSDRAPIRQRDRGPGAVRDLLELEVRRLGQAVLRAAAARASSSRRRMRGFASLTISSR
jgi:hypothetical protein